MEENKDKKLSIFLSIDSFFPMRDGNVIALDNLAKALVKKGHEVTAIAPKGAKRPKIEGYNVLYNKSFFKKRKYPIPSSRLDKKIQETILSSKYPIIINAHSSYFMGKAVMKFARKNDIPSVFTLHTKLKQDFLGMSKSKLITKIAIQKQVDLINEFDSLISVSSGAIYDLEEFNIRDDAIIIPNGADLNLPEIEKTKRDHIFRILFVGHLTWQKGFKTIIDTLAILKHNNFSFIFTAVGEGMDEKGIKGYTKKKGVFDKMKFEGFVSDITELGNYYSSHDLFFFPSTFDTFGIVVREAAFYSLPTLAIKNSDVSMFIVDNENGFLSNIDANSLATKITEIASLEQNELLKIGKNAKKSLTRNYDEVADDYLKVYRKTLGLDSDRPDYFKDIYLFKKSKKKRFNIYYLGPIIIGTIVVFVLLFLIVGGYIF